MSVAIASKGTEAEGLTTVASLLGGNRLLGDALATRLDAHEMLLQGLPGESLTYLVDHVRSLRNGAAFEKALGMSLRTFQRRKEAPSKPLSPEQSGRAWKFADILTRTTAVLGTQDEAEHWLERPAIGLEQRCPIDLLSTPAGVQLVETLLERMEYGVYT